MQPNSPYQQSGPQPDYSFIVDPNTAPVGRPSLFGGSSLIARALLVLAIFIIIIILFSVVKGILSGGGVAPLFLGTAQDQQAMLHITDKATEEPTISSPNKNFAITASLSIASDQTKTVDYLRKNGTKVNAKQVNLKLSLPLDTQLKDAAAASTYNATFAQIMKAKLMNYDQALQQTYGKTKGVKGRQLLKSEHSNTELLLKQLEAANP